VRLLSVRVSWPKLNVMIDVLVEPDIRTVDTVATYIEVGDDSTADDVIQQLKDITRVAAGPGDTLQAFILETQESRFVRLLYPGAPPVPSPIVVKVTDG